MDVRRGQWWLVAGGLLVATLGTALATIAASFLVPFRVGGIPIPVSVAITAVANVVAVQFSYLVTRQRWVVAGPALSWLVVVIWLAFPATEGDFVISGTWVGVSVVLAGAAALTVGVTGVLMKAAQPVNSAR